MAKEEMIRITSWSINVDIAANVSTVYLRGQTIEEVKNIIFWHTKISGNLRDYVIFILKLAQECNANLLEVRSYTKPNVLRFSFEFEFREDFLRFEKKLKELSL